MDVLSVHPSKIGKPLLPVLEQVNNNKIIKAFLLKQLESQIQKDKKEAEKANRENKKIENNQV